MENIKRSIRIFFTTFGGLLFQIIGIIAIVLFAIHGVNNLYKENTKTQELEESKLSEEVQIKKELLEKENENRLFISEFIDYCNENKIEEAYNMLSEECIKDKYQTIEKFEDEYVNKIFTYKKDYEIEIEDNLYKVTIMEGILQSGKIDNRNSITSSFTIEESVLEKKINIER